MVWQKEYVEKLIEDFELAIQKKDARIAELQEKIADLRAQVATLQIDVADWKVIAKEHEKIVTIAVQRYNEAKAENATLAGLALDGTNIFSYSTPPNNAA